MNRLIFLLSLTTILLNTEMIKASTPPYPPEATLLAPDAHSLGYVGKNTYITAEFSDADGLGDLVFMNILVGEGTNIDSGCFIQYHGSQNRMKLRDPASSSWIEGDTPGTPGLVLESSYCILNVEDSTVTHVGSDVIQVKANVTFKSEFIAGNALHSKNIYLWAGDAGGLSTGGWLEQELLVLRSTIDFHPPTASISAPTLPSTSYIGQETFITAEFRDIDGRGDLVFMNLQISEDTAVDTACIVRFQASMDKIDLMNDEGDAWQTGGRPGAREANVKNSQCALNVEKSTVIPVDLETLQVRIALTFRPEFISNTSSVKGVYLFAKDAAGLDSGALQDQGSLTLLSSVDSAVPAARLFEPELPVSTYIYQGGYLTVDYSDANGWQDLSHLRLQINESPSADATGCIVQYKLDEHFDGHFELKNDSGDSWLIGEAPGSENALLENSRCVLDIEKSSVEAIDDRTLRVRSRITFKPAFIAGGNSGDKSLYLWADDHGGSNTGGWVDEGTWMVRDHVPSARPPEVTLTTPTLPSIFYDEEAVNISFEVRDDNGAQNIQSSFLRIGEDEQNGIAAVFWYRRDQEMLYLRTDHTQGQIEFGSGAVLGTPGEALENAYVWIDIGSSFAETDGATLRLNLRMVFKEFFVGDKNLYLFAEDHDGLTSAGWAHQGAVTIEKPLMVCLMGDPQIGFNDMDLVPLGYAMSDLALLDHSALFIVGDLVQYARQNWDQYDDYLASESLVPIFPLAGNSDFVVGLDEYLERTGRDLWYTVEQRGIRFIVLSTTELKGADNHICVMGTEQLVWLTEELEADTEITTVILFHAPMLDTTYYSQEADMFYLHESDAVRNLMRAHPNVATYAHGHVHSEYEKIDKDSGRGHFALKDGVLHLRAGATIVNRGTRCLYVYHDRIVSRVRNHQYGHWRPELEVGIDLPTTLESSKP